MGTDVNLTPEDLNAIDKFNKIDSGDVDKKIKVLEESLGYDIKKSQYIINLQRVNEKDNYNIFAYLLFISNNFVYEK